jgi:hypothetical protein
LRQARIASCSPVVEITTISLHAFAIAELLVSGFAFFDVVVIWDFPFYDRGHSPHLVIGKL